MRSRFGGAGPIRAAAMTSLAIVIAGAAAPALAQETMQEARIRRMEAEIRALQRQVFPGGSGKYFAPEIAPATPASPAANAAGTAGAATPVTDLLSRMDSVEAQLKRLTAQAEENAHKLAQLEARTAGIAPSAATPAAAAPAASATPTATPAPTPTAADSNLSAMTGGASAPKPAPAAASTAKPAAGGAPSAQRLAAVRAIAKPTTADAGDDEYTYGFRLWEAKFFPEAQQQLKLMVEKYPRHAKISFARNLLGRAYLDDGKPREAASWFLQNYQANKSGDRAADSLVLLAEAMRQLKDSSRACIALAEFAETYPREAAGRLKSQYDTTRGGVKCN
jgi:TolA-binding protein